MKVQLLTSVVGRKDGRQYSYKSGDIVEIEDETAKRMIAKHRALAVDAPPSDKKTADKKKDTK